MTQEQTIWQLENGNKNIISITKFYERGEHMEAVYCAIISGLFGLATVIINKNTNKKVDKFEDIKEEILEQVKQNREGYEKEISNHILENDKTYLTDFLSDVESGEPKTEMQIHRAYEIKREYNKLGGDSYIDDKWDELVKMGILKERKVS